VWVWLCGALALGPPLVGALEARGAVGLDAVSFEKLVGRHFDVLVKFDKQYAYGEKEDAWKAFASKIGEHALPDLLLATVGVQDYGDKVNEDLRQRFAVDPAAFPAFRLFRKGSTEPIPYTGEVTADALSGFLVAELGIYISRPGCIKEFDALAHGFAVAAPTERAQRLAAAERAAEALATDTECESAAFYLNVMRKIDAKDPGYASKERARLEKLVQSRITEDKKKAMRMKLGILPSFE